jgi:hypothetical protein
MDEEFEEVVEFVGEGVDGAGLGLGSRKGEGEGEQGLVAGCEGDVLEVAEAVCDLCSGNVSDRTRRDGSSTVAASRECVLEDEGLMFWRVLTCSPVSLDPIVSVSEACHGMLCSYIVLFRQLTGTRSPFVYPVLFGPLSVAMGSSAAFTVMHSEV